MKKLKEKIANIQNQSWRASCEEWLPILNGGTWSGESWVHNTTLDLLECEAKHLAKTAIYDGKNGWHLHN